MKNKNLNFFCLVLIIIFFTTSLKSDEVNKLIDPLMSECFNWDEIPTAHTKMMNNKHLPGNMAALVQARKIGMKTLSDLN